MQEIMHFTNINPFYSSPKIERDFSINNIKSKNVKLLLLNMFILQSVQEPGANIEQVQTCLKFINVMSNPPYIIDLICGIQLVVRIKYSLSKCHYNHTTQYTDDCHTALFTAGLQLVVLSVQLIAVVSKQMTHGKTCTG